MIHALHGNFGLPTDWTAALPAHLPATTYHLWQIRRHHSETHTLTGFAKWLNPQIAALPPDPHRLLIGYSLGGRLALHLIADRPDLWPRALLLSTHPGLTSNVNRTARLVHDAAWKTRCLTTPLPALLDAWHAQPVLSSNIPSTPPDPLAPWLPEIADAFTGWSLGLQADHLPLLAPLPTTGLWLTGANDLKFNALAEQATRTLPHFTHQTIPHSGHRLLTDQPLAVSSAILQLLS